MNIKSLFATTSMAVVGLAFVACSHADFIDEDAPVKKLKAEYAANFEKKYGKIAPNQSWDFSSMQPTYSLPSTSTNAARTRAGEGSFDRTIGELKVEKDVIAYMLDNMPEGKNNKVKGSPFTMTVPGNAFTIVPIFQGYARYYWQLWMYVEGVGHHLVWSKGDDFYYRNNSEDQWTPLGTGIGGINRANARKNPCEVKGPSYTYANLPEGATMYFYLKVWWYDYDNGYEVYQRWLENPNDPKVKMKTCSSLSDMMINLENAKKPADIDADNDVTIIGCEDNDNGDYDYEDLVFMVYGHPVPPTERLKEVEVTQTKRYMMEDLGTTDDFDFNDVVVDVQTGKKITYTYDNATDKLLSKVESETKQQAIIRAAGGTMDFTLTIGNTKWTKNDKFNIGDMINTGWNGAIDYNAVLDKFEVKGWDPATNNVSVSVVNRGGSGQVNTITFPKEGTAPMMIAVDPEVKWMKERQSIPTSWFTVPEENSVTE